MPFAPLTAPEARVLGCLLEKEMVTPEYYPMTLNGLTNACNQKTNRDPVVSYGEDEVSEVLEHLRERGLSIKVSGGGGRVPKFRHTLCDALRLTPAEAATLCVLLLRGPQTLGEIRSRASRMCAFEDLAQVETTLDGLAGPRPAGGDPLAIRLTLQPGHKEYRYMHLLGGDPEVGSSIVSRSLIDHPAGAAGATGEPAAALPADAAGGAGRLDTLEERVEALESELAAMRRQFSEFKAQFE